MIERQLLWSARSVIEYETLLDYLWDELDEAIKRIIANPEHFQVVIKRKTVRRCLFSPQISIYFRINKDIIEIISLFDNRQNPKKLKKLYNPRP